MARGLPRLRRWTRALALSCTCACACSACDASRASVGEASDALQRHRAAFVALDRWTRRTLSGAELIKNERALAETVFAKARAERSVSGAWVEQAGPPKLALAMPDAAPVPAMTDARRVRDAELGTLEVRLGAPCPVKSGALGRGGTGASATAPKLCTLIARGAPSPRGQLRLSVAFED